MKTLSRLILTLAWTVLFAAGASAQTPDVYLRGEFDPSWSALPEYKFTLEGDTYTLHVDRLDGRFKIASEDWATVDLGSSDTHSSVSAGTYPVKMTPGGTSGPMTFATSPSVSLSRPMPMAM